MPPRHFIADMDRILVPAFLVTDPEAEDYKQWKRDHPDSIRVPCRLIWRDPKTGAVVKAANRHDPLEDPKPRHGAENDAAPTVIPVLPPAGPHVPPVFLPRTPSVAPSGPARAAPGGRTGGSVSPSMGTAPGATVDDLDPATPEERRRLRAALERLGKIAPGQEAHHIVPGGGAMSGARNPALSQRLLREARIGLDSAENGVALSTEFHRRLHTAGYYDYVQEQLLRAVTPQGVRPFLSRLAQRLKDADAEFRQSGQMPTWENDQS